MIPLSSPLHRWRGTTFANSTGLTEQFRAFARDFQKALRQAIGPDYDLVAFRRGHFELSGFLQHNRTGRFTYWSISDVRFFPEAWANHILIRTAAHPKDFTGGMNYYTPLDEFRSALDRLVG